MPGRAWFQARPGAVLITDAPFIDTFEECGEDQPAPVLIRAEGVHE